MDVGRKPLYRGVLSSGEFSCLHQSQLWKRSMRSCGMSVCSGCAWVVTELETSSHSYHTHPTLRVNAKPMCSHVTIENMCTIACGNHT